MQFKLVTFLQTVGQDIPEWINGRNLAETSSLCTPLLRNLFEPTSVGLLKILQSCHCSSSKGHYNKTKDYF